jgi:hypothetical protein
MSEYKNIEFQIKQYQMLEAKGELTEYAQGKLNGMLEVMNIAKDDEVLCDVSKRELLNDILMNQEEVISSPIRFNGVAIEKLKQIFENNGVKYESPF